MDFANLTVMKNITTSALTGKLYRDRFEDDCYYLMVESPLPLCLFVGGSVDDQTAEEILLSKASDIISFWRDIKNGVFDT